MSSRPRGEPDPRANPTYAGGDEDREVDVPTHQHAALPFTTPGYEQLNFAPSYYDSQLIPTPEVPYFDQMQYSSTHTRTVPGYDQNPSNLASLDPNASSYRTTNASDSFREATLNDAEPQATSNEQILPEMTALKPETQYSCDICYQQFAYSDMLK
jgi:hypothetical protein